MPDESLFDGPRVFVSYSWSSVEHQEWVIDLAKDLVANGVDVVLDKWSLREGQDKYHFMEQMVADPTVKKVILVCDRRYEEKADSREGGVGTESQIVSKEIYESVAQTKFVAVVTEYDNDGNPCTPAFFKSRVYIDMSTPSKRYESLEQLLRWIYDKPLHEKPALGRRPSFLEREAALALGTAGQFQRASFGRTRCSART